MGILECRLTHELDSLNRKCACEKLCDNNDNNNKRVEGSVDRLRLLKHDIHHIYFLKECVI